MLNSFIKIKWFNTISSKWVSDYICEDEVDHCIISSLDDCSDRFSFVMAKHLVRDILCSLNEAMVAIRKIEHLPLDVKVINLGFNCDNNLISGKFSIHQNDSS